MSNHRDRQAQETMRVVIGDRPANIPEGWSIWNAPRPLMGDIEWQAEPNYGTFYAAIDPYGEYAQDWTRYNRRHDARRLRYVSRDDLTKQLHTRGIAQGIAPDDLADQQGWYWRWLLDDWWREHGEVTVVVDDGGDGA